MKKVFSLGLTVVFMLAQGGWAGADEVSELREMMMQMKEDYEGRIDQLEQKLDSLESKQQKTDQAQQKMVQNAPAADKNNVNMDYVGRHNAPVGAGGLVVGNSSGRSNISLGGYYDLEYHNFEDAESTFRQHHWNLNVGAQVTDRILMNAELEFEYGGSNAEAGDGESRVEQAYVDYLINDTINLRGGAVLAPFGRYNLYHDADMQDLTDRPLVARDVIPTTWTEVGVGVYGEVNPTIGDYEDMSVSYQVYAVNGLDDGFSDTGLGDARESWETDNNDGKSVVGRVVLSPANGHELGLSGYHGPYRGHDDITGGAVDWFSSIGPFEVITEYAYFSVEETPTATSDFPNFLQGAYAQVNYHFWFDFLNDTFLGRGFENPTFTLTGRYDWAEIDDDDDADFGNNEETRWTIGLNYRPIENFVVKFEYQFNDTENETLEHASDGLLASVALGF